MGLKCLTDLQLKLCDYPTEKQKQTGTEYDISRHDDAIKW